MLHLICQQICKTQQWPQNWKRSIFISIPKKCNAKNAQTTTQLHSSHMLAWRGNGTQKALQFLPGNSHGQRSLVGCSPWGREESDTTEQLHFHFSLSCIREGNGNSGVLAWRIPGTGEPGGLLSMGSHRVGHD